MSLLLDKPLRTEAPAAPPNPDQPIWRARILGVFLVLIFAGLISRLWYLQVAHGQDFVKAAAANHTRLLRVGAPRGAIVDCQGRILASNRSQFALYAQPSVAKDPSTLLHLAKLLGETPDDIQQVLKTEKKNDYDPIRIALDVPISLVTKIEEERPYLPGVSAEPEPVRWYPGNTLMGNALGTLGRIDPDEYKKLQAAGYYPDDFVGKTGLEDEYEKYLHGTPGGTLLEIDARGREVKSLGQQVAVPGDTVVLSVDKKVQEAAESTFKLHHFIGAAVAVNPQNGAVLAMASSPSIDPNQFATGITKPNWNALSTNPQKPLMNRAIDALYPPGSTYKQVVAAAGLQSGAINTHTTAYCTGVYSLGKARFHCWQVHGMVDFFRAIAVSCDVFFYQAGRKMGPDTMSYYARQYPLAQHTGIDMPHEMIGSIPSPAWKKKHFGRLGADYSTWYPGDTINMSIGQGYVLTTPLQMALVTATTANGGYVLRPYLMQRIVTADGKPVIASQRVVLRKVSISDQNLAYVREGMRQTVTSGTGHIVDFPNVAVAAKTGSAQVHGSPVTHGWFVAFAPFDHPTIACAAVVEHGGHGASSAGYVVRAMLEAYFGMKVDLGGPAGKSD
ncbi:MAG TPA: penicillin-binding protein 2 [Capsulimonadaceae bacterium]|nr:penicillin-binding protein 2 [Capsulimonadaceae bacterium]